MTPVTIQLVAPLSATHWAVVWWVEGHERVTYMRDKTLAEAYAAAHRGQIVPLAAMAEWPRKPE